MAAEDTAAEDTVTEDTAAEDTVAEEPAFEDTAFDLTDLYGSTVSHGGLQEELREVRVPALTILAHPDPRRVGERVLLPALASGGEVELSRLEPQFTAPEGGAARPLADKHLSRQASHLEPDGASGGIVLRRGAARTAIELDGFAMGEEQRLSKQALQVGVTIVLADRVALLLHEIELMPRPEKVHADLVGESPAMHRLQQQILEIAAHPHAVLLRGETGTGKELVARAIHHASPRSAKPLVCVNMGALPPTLAAAELFGAARGAYTGAARKRRGYFQRAHGGTLFLDEIGETPPEVQVLLLRVLETGEVQPVGAAESVRVDVRVVAATDAALEAAIADGRFRAPLLHRLAGLEIHLPRLRERRDDIGRLLGHFLRRELESLGKAARMAPTRSRQRPWLPATAVARLARCPWPGNVRQLLNVARQLVVAGREAPQVRVTPEIAALLDEVKPPEEATPKEPGTLASPVPGTPPDVPSTSEPDAAPTSLPPVVTPFGDRRPAQISEDELIATLKANHYRLLPTAAALGISRTSLYSLIDKSSRIRKAGDLTRGEIERCRERQAGDLDAMAAELEVSRKGLRRRMTDLGID